MLCEPQNGCTNVVNPLLTALFDLFLIGSAIAIVTAMAIEHLDSRAPSVGAPQHKAVARPRTGRAVVARRARCRGTVRSY